MPTTATKTRWMLEIAKGAEPGRRYSLDHGETTIGNGPWASSYISLADQEGNSPRRMAPKQATLSLAGDKLVIRDLESPGGTFVNRQRLFTKQERALSPGDVIQVGAVHIIVRSEPAKAEPPKPAAPKPASAVPPRPTNGAARPTATATTSTPPPKPSPPQPPRPGPLASPYAFPDGSTCRSWDDFLTLSAQRWAIVRDELASGRMGEHLRLVGRSDLMPRREPGWTPDEVLDEWLGRLPTAGASGPELDVHPDELTVPAGSAGSVVRRSFRVANVGYRILRPTIAIEAGPGMSGAICLAAGAANRPLAIIDEAEVVIEVEPPEDAYDVTLGAVVVTAGGMTRRIGVRVERPKVEAVPEGADFATGTAWSPVRPLGDRLSGLSLARRLWTFPIAALALRGLIGLGGRLPYLSTGGELRLAGASALPALVGAIIGWAVGSRGGFRDAIASTFAGAIVGVLAASVVFASARSFEGVFGSPWLSAAALGVGLAAASCLAIPPVGKGEQA